MESVGIPTLFPDFNTIALGVSLFSVMLAVGLYYTCVLYDFYHMTFIMLQYVAPNLSISRTFYHEGMLYFVKGSSFDKGNY